MTAIAAGLFLFALGSEDFARSRVTEPGIWMVFLYAVVVVGLAQYRRWHWIAYRSAFMCLCCSFALILGVWLFRMNMSARICGVVLFVFALTDIVIGFFIPWKEDIRPKVVQKTDWIGYAVIFAAVLIACAIGYVVIR